VIFKLATRQEVDAELVLQVVELIYHLTDSSDNLEAFGRELGLRIAVFLSRDLLQDDLPHMQVGSTHPDRILFDQLCLDVIVYVNVRDAERVNAEQLTRRN
jgi:hypothetical protein